MRLSARFARNGALRAAELERAPEMPFARGQVVQLRQDRAEQIVRLRIQRIDAQGGAGERIGVGVPSHRDSSSISSL